MGDNGSEAYCLALFHQMHCLVSPAFNLRSALKTDIQPQRILEMALERERPNEEHGESTCCIV